MANASHSEPAGAPVPVLTAAHLPKDWRRGTFVGRLLTADGPTPIAVSEGAVWDMSLVAPTVSQLLNERAGWRADRGRLLGDLESLALNPSRDGPGLLAPADLQCVKAAGVTFAASMLERVIEERAAGDPAKAVSLRAALQDRLGGDLRGVRPGSTEAEALKDALVGAGLWSQYLEVAIGPDAEIFTKAPVLSSVGWGQAIGIRSDSAWNNPEPEIVLACTATGDVVGATLGNDVNLRDFEGRSALLLGKAKDNNASCALGPLIRLFDDDYTIDHVRSDEVTLEVEGADGFHLTGLSSMREISRDPLELVRQTMSEHQYPDGFMLFLGTLFAPSQDRHTPSHGFTHNVGDRVRISSPRLGVLENTVTTSAEAPPWRIGIGALITNLAARGLLRA